MAEGRFTVYNEGIVTPEKWEKVNPKNKDLMKEFLSYLTQSDKSPQTVHQYEAQLKQVMVFIMENCDNIHFTELKKRDLIRFSGWLTSTLKVSNKRVQSMKSVISSLSNYIESVLDEDYPNFRNISKVITISSKDPVREKTILEEDEIIACMDKMVEDKKYQCACFMALLYASGMRKGEAIQMRVDDFRENAKKVFQGKFYKTRKIRTKGPGKNGKQLAKYVLVDIFDKYFNIWMDYREHNGIESPWLFIVNNQGVYNCAKISTANSFAKTMTEYLKVPGYCHNFRHAWCTRLHKLGYPETVIQTLQGWAGLDMVSLYNDTSDEDQLEDFFAAQLAKENSDE